MPKFDELTGLLAGQGLESRLDRLLDAADESGEHLSLIIGDLGGLKRINQTFGREAGDLALVAAGRAIADTVGEAAFCFRLGGDAFVMLLPGATSDHAAGYVFNLRRQIESTRVSLAGGETFALTAFWGVATYPEDARSSKSLLRVADRRMHSAREAASASEPPTSA
jgi:diguanylate cyclase (GGDEF)-like protein